ncbi:thioester dehydrase [Shewanella colwelliana]|uniref:ApeP family dehydratase n=1 Tax=Shewanella colwelliana TaxID=23 RepID=UPI00299EC42E|nr:thioester dehydrase [Shewanella colwelliana]MDX1281067.1 thioester dehydrase [Shewanella colwelliana]
MSQIVDVSHIAVDDVVPHRAPMILIDRLLQHQPDSLTTEVTIGKQSAYYNSHTASVPNYVGIEYMAQSIAALAGIEAIARDEPIQVGFLLGTRKLAMNIADYKLDQCYQVSVTRLYQEESGLAVFDCQISHQDQIVASANVNVFQPQDTQAYIADSIQGNG